MNESLTTISIKIILNAMLILVKLNIYESSLNEKIVVKCSTK